MDHAVRPLISGGKHNTAQGWEPDQFKLTKSNDVAGSHAGSRRRASRPVTVPARYFRPAVVSEVGPTAGPVQSLRQVVSGLAAQGMARRIPGDDKFGGGGRRGLP